jgi:hypothetical protein
VRGEGRERGVRGQEVGRGGWREREGGRLLGCLNGWMCEPCLLEERPDGGSWLMNRTNDGHARLTVGLELVHHHEGREAVQPTRRPKQGAHKGMIETLRQWRMIGG